MLGRAVPAVRRLVRPSCQIIRGLHQSPVLLKEHKLVSESILNRVKPTAPSPFSNLTSPHKDLPSASSTASHSTSTTYVSPTEISTLPNGIRVVTDNSPTPTSVIGVVIGAGHADEVPEKGGALWLLERMLTKSTTSRSSADIVAKWEELGLNPMCLSSRENIVKQMELLPETVPEAMELFADSLLNPLYDPAEIEEQNQALQMIVEDMPRNSVPFMQELLHETAFGGQGLGASVMQYALNLTRQDMLDLHKELFVGDKLVFGALGVPHDQFRDMIAKYFGHLPQTNKDGDKMLRPIVSKYVGGFKLLNELPSKYPLPPNHRPVTHFAVAFPAPTYTNPDDTYAASVLQTLLGGGSAFSGGGPGKGMYSRFYVDVLNKHNFVELAQGQLAMYRDSGLFGIVSSAHPSEIKKLVDVIVYQITKMGKNITRDELSRAKNQVKVLLCSQLESRMIKSEDMMKQILSYNKRHELPELLAGIEKVTAEDLQRVTQTMVASKPTIVGYGEHTSIAKIPKYSDIVNYLQMKI